ncbi:palmitoyltransferase ZDHHC2-like [Pollicipes pollicipes]|uniref:palmitoyltransferase ZDHHC2-like n=1 Tax=Pollicipes pollicipes TaxID=41117 RepID=UPI001884B439|nr:palmitoyltransferase ZDHHC2-like [Pollicipes pollicipes]
MGSTKTNRSYIVAKYLAPTIHLFLIGSLTTTTVVIKLAAGESVWFYLIFPVLIFANWAQFLRHPSYVEPSDRAENRVSRYPLLRPDQCQPIRPSDDDVHERIMDPAPRFQVADGVHFCRRCAFHVPACSHHCPLCLHCIRLRDHHCFFLGACVGRDNMVYFLAFCLHACLGCAVAAYCISAHLHRALMPLDTVQGAINFVPPIAMASWALGNISALVLGYVVLVYLAATTSLGTGFMFGYQIGAAGVGPGGAHVVGDAAAGGVAARRAALPARVRPLRPAASAAAARPSAVRLARPG